MCYISAGTYEDFRADKALFPADALGGVVSFGHATSEYTRAPAHVNCKSAAARRGDLSVSSCGPFWMRLVPVHVEHPGCRSVAIGGRAYLRSTAVWTRCRLQCRNRSLLVLEIISTIPFRLSLPCAAAGFVHDTSHGNMLLRAVPGFFRRRRRRE